MTAIDTHVVLFTDKDKAELLPTSVRPPAAGEVRVRTLRSAVSPGTELRIGSGGEHSFSGFPAAPGYALCGEVESVGEGAGLAIGDRVVAQRSSDEADLPRGSHIGYAVTPASACVPVPAGVAPEAAALARVLSIGHRGARQATPRIGETVAVIGLGVIGLSAALAATLTGARVACFNRSADRVDLARRLGLEAHAAGDDLAASVRGVLEGGGGGADVLIDATGHPETMKAAVPAVRDLDWSDGDRGTARYVLLGSVNGDVALPYFPAFFRELTVHVPRYTDNHDAAEVLRLMGLGKLDVSPLTDGATFTPGDCDAAYHALRDRRPGLATAIFDWEQL